MEKAKGSRIGYLVGGSAGVIIGLLIGLTIWNYFYREKPSEQQASKDVSPATTFSTDKLMYEKGLDPEIALLRKELESQKALALEEKNKAGACEEKRSTAKALWKEQQKKNKQQPVQGAHKNVPTAIVVDEIPTAVVSEEKIADDSDFFYQQNGNLLNGVE